MDAIFELIEKIEWFSSFLELLLCTYFCSAFMEHTRKNKKSNVVGSVMIAFIMAFVANQIFFIYGMNIVHAYQKKILFIVLCVIVQWVFYRRKYVQAVVVSFLYGELSMVVELVAEFIISNVGLLPYQQKIVFLLWKIPAITIEIVFLYGLVPKTPIPFIHLLMIGVFTVISLIWNWVLTGAEGVIHLPDEFHRMVMILMVVTFFLFQIVVIFLILKIGETHQQKQTAALIELNNKMLQKSLDETEQTFALWRQSVHDYKNHIIVLKQMIEENRLEEIKTFLEEESDSISKQLFMIRTGNAVVDTLVNLKRALAERYQITFLVHGTVPEKLVIEDMDLANILGNLLDNAIEASMKEQEAYIDLTIKQEKNFFLLCVRNKCTNALEKEIDISSKEYPEFHGIGLKSVKRAVKKYDGQMQIEQTSQEFRIHILIQNLL